MKKEEFCISCPYCQRRKHSLEANFCSFCGEKLVKGRLLEFYLSLKIPKSKILIEEKNPYVFTGFPFFLRKKNGIEIECITFHDYPLANRLYVKLNRPKAIADRSEEISMKEDTLNELISDGFEWFHHSEMATMW